jgi:hypothetical protein
LRVSTNTIQQKSLGLVFPYFIFLILISNTPFTMTDDTSTAATASATPAAVPTSTNQDDASVYQDLLTFLQSPQRADLRLEATKAVLQCSPDR